LSGLFYLFGQTKKEMMFLLLQSSTAQVANFLKIPSARYLLC